MLKYASMLPVFLLVLGCGKEPTNYADCILEHIKSGQTKDAVVVIHRACEQKFPEASKVEEENYFAQFDDEPIAEDEYRLGAPISEEEAKALGLTNAE